VVAWLASLAFERAPDSRKDELAPRGAVK
jgi:hypothetical protein